MKKIIIIVLILLVVIGGLFVLTNNHETTQTTTQSETNTETIQKEITKINVSIEHNNIIVEFIDNTYLDTNLNKFFFTETTQKEFVIKEYDKNNNLINVNVFYNPNTTEF